MWPRLGDLVVIYTLLTPLCVMYWYATFKLLDMYLEENLYQMLVGGYIIVVLTIVLREPLRCVAEVFQHPCIYEFIYDYIVFTACLSYIHGCKTYYNLLVESLPPIAIVGIITTFLIVVRGFRNIMALPAVVNNDTLQDRYSPHSTLHFFGRGQGISKTTFLSIYTFCN